MKGMWDRAERSPPRARAMWSFGGVGLLHAWRSGALRVAARASAIVDADERLADACMQAAGEAA